MKLLLEIMKFLPNNLNNLTLDLTNNNLGDKNAQIIKNLTEIINLLPNNLQNSELNLDNNNLVNYASNF